MDKRLKKLMPKYNSTSKTHKYYLQLGTEERNKIEALVKHYQDLVPTIFTRVDIIRIAINELYKNKVEKKE